MYILICGRYFFSLFFLRLHASKKYRYNRIQINFFFLISYETSMKNNRLTYITMKVKGNVIEAEVAHQLPTSCLPFRTL